MRKLLVILFLIPLFSSGQDYITITDSLNAIQSRVIQAYDALKELRDQLSESEVNYQSINPCSSFAYNDAYKTYYNDITSIKRVSIKTSLEKLKGDLPFFQNCPLLSDTIQYLQNTQLPDTDSILFFTVLSLLEASDLNYENRLFTIEFSPLDSNNIPSGEKSILIRSLVKDYNLALKSVGRRMGRVIQSAVLEDADYITPASQTRVDLALSDLRVAELHLRNALVDEKPSQQTVNFIHITPSEKKTENLGYFHIATDLSDNFGVGILFNTPKIDFGADLYFVFQTEGGIQVHPKIGVPVGNFHFLAGMLLEPSAVDAFSYEYTGNVYYTNNEFTGGIGFSKNRVLFYFGIPFSKAFKFGKSKGKSL